MREPLYTLEQVTVRRDGRLVLTVERLALGQGRLTALFGPNGAGKSTLLRLLALYTRPDSGTLTFLGRSWDEVDRATRRQVVFLPQHPFLLDGSVLANVAYGLRIRGVRRHLDRRAAEALAWVGLPEAFLHRSVHTLSGGERQRVALAARLVLRPRVLLLDEPTASVDLESAQHIRRAMLMAGGRWGATLVVSSHDHNWLRPMAEAQIMLFRGRVMDSGQVNILFGPWRMEDGMACTRLAGGGWLRLPCRQGVSGAAVALVDPKTGLGPAQEREPDLAGRITAVRAAREPDMLELELVAGEMVFRMVRPAAEVRRRGWLPGDRLGLRFFASGIRFVA